MGLRDELGEALAAEVEARLRDGVLRLAGRALQTALNADHSDQSEPHRTCACGGVARFAGRRPRTIVTVLAEIRIERAYYHCAACGQGFCPRDRALGIEDSHLSPGVLRMVGMVGASVSFEEGAGLLRDLAGIRVPYALVDDRIREILATGESRESTRGSTSPSTAVPTALRTNA